MTDTAKDLPLKTRKVRSLADYIPELFGLFTFIFAVIAIGYLIYQRGSTEIVEQRQLTSETTALIVLIVTSFGVLSTFIFNWRNDRRNERNEELKIKNKELEEENFRLKARLEIERERIEVEKYRIYLDHLAKEFEIRKEREQKLLKERVDNPLPSDND